MFSADYLSLKLFRLNTPEFWSTQGNELSFLFLKAGAGEYVSDSLKHRLAPGDVLVVNGDPNGKLHSSESDEIVFSCFSVEVQHLYPLVCSSEIPFLEDVIQELKRTRHYPATTRIAEECHSLLTEAPEGFGFTHRSHLLQLVAAVVAEELRKGRTNRSGYISVLEHLDQVFEGLSLDEIQDLSLDELAAKFGCSPRHLNRLFNDHFGLTVGAFLMEMRLMKALTLLRNPNAKVINVAGDCGFNHLGFFNTCFKRRFGSSPGQWRKRNSGRLASLSTQKDHADREQQLECIGLSPSVPQLVVGDNEGGIDDHAGTAGKESPDQVFQTSLIKLLRPASRISDLVDPALDFGSA